MASGPADWTLLGFSDASVPRNRRCGHASASLSEALNPLTRGQTILAGPMRVTYLSLTTVASMEIVGMLLQLRMAINLLEATGHAGPVRELPAPRLRLQCYCDSDLAARVALEETPESLRSRGAPHLVPMHEELSRHRDRLRSLYDIQIEFRVPARGRRSRGIRAHDEVARGLRIVEDEPLPADIAAALNLATAELHAASCCERQVMTEQY